MFVSILNIIFIVFVLAGFITLLVFYGCHNTKPISLTDVTDATLGDIGYFIDRMNVATNILIAIPAIMFLCMFFWLEGLLLLLTAFVSSLWHASGWEWVGICDNIFAALSFLLVLIFGFVRILQVGGLPLLSGAYFMIPVFAGIMFLSRAFLCDDKNNESARIKERMLHFVWHILVGVTFLLVVTEIAKFPALIPNEDIRNFVASSQGISFFYKPYPTLVDGALRSMFNIKPKISIISM